MKTIGDANIVGKEKTLRICVVSFPMPSAIVVNVFLYNLVEILEPICERVYVVASNIPKDRAFSNKIRIHDVKTAMHFRDTIRPMWWSTILQLFKIIIIQMKMCLVLTKISKEIDIVIFYVGGANLFFPLLMAKILRKKVLLLVAGLDSRGYRKAHNNRLFSIGGTFTTLLSILERANLSLSDTLITQSESAAEFSNLGRYKQKLVFTGARYINTDSFQIKKELNERKKLIGYIGRVHEGKGVMDFVKAMPLILERHKDMEFLIGGDGPAYDEIKEELRNSNLSRIVKLIGWIPHDRIPSYLNELKLFVLPSYSEGLPTGVLEAMACGAVVLATPVGGVPDVIKDGETGFVLENNSPECIARNVKRALEHPNLDEIVKNAKNLIEEKYTYEAAVERYIEILNNLYE